MNILFITSSRIGDAVLSTGLLNYMVTQYPKSKITIVCGPLASSLFEGAPNVVEVISLEKQKHNKHWIGLWKRVVSRKWDIVVDLRNSAVSRLIRHGALFAHGSYVDKSLHKVEQNASVMKLQKPPSPKLWFSDAQKKRAIDLVPDGVEPVLAVGPAANWPAKTWPAERFIEVVKAATAQDGILPDARVAVFAAPGEEEVARQVLQSVPENKRIDVIAKCDPGTAAAAISRCDFYLGNDSGLMHCAAAVGIPTLGVFGPSFPHIYRPWEKNADYVGTKETFNELIAYEGYSAETAPCLMNSLATDTVIEAMENLWKKYSAKS